MTVESLFWLPEQRGWEWKIEDRKPVLGWVGYFSKKLYWVGRDRGECGSKPNEASGRMRRKTRVAALVMLVRITHKQIIYRIFLNQTFCPASDPLLQFSSSGKGWLKHSGPLVLYFPWKRRE